MYVCIYIYVCIYVCNVCVYVCIYVCNVCMYVCMYVFMYVCVCVCNEMSGACGPHGGRERSVQVAGGETRREETAGETQA